MYNNRDLICKPGDLSPERLCSRTQRGKKPRSPTRNTRPPVASVSANTTHLDLRALHLGFDLFESLSSSPLTMSSDKERQKLLAVGFLSSKLKETELLSRLEVRIPDQNSDILSFPLYFWLNFCISSPVEPACVPQGPPTGERKRSGYRRSVPEGEFPDCALQFESEIVSGFLFGPYN